MLLLPASAVRDDELEASAAQTHGEAFHLCATAHLGVSTVKQTVYMAKSMGVELISEKEWYYIHGLIVRGEK
jgi:hypothetical protein